MNNPSSIHLPDWADGVDCYGRKRNKSQSTSAKEELKEFYEIEDEEAPTTGAKSGKKNKGDVESRLDYLNKLSRGEISGSSSSDDDSSENSDSDASPSDMSSSDDDSEDDEGVDNPLAVPGDDVSYAEQGDQKADLIEDSCRLAIQNCEWEKVTAEDLL